MTGRPPCWLGNTMRAGLLSIVAISAAAFAQQRQMVWSDQEKPLAQQLRGLRQLPDDARAAETKHLAIAIRRLPRSPNKLPLAAALANLSTEGDFGRDVLQEVANTLAEALRERPPANVKGKPASEYSELARLVRYEHVETSLDATPFKQAMAQLEANDEARYRANFTLRDLQGKTWNLRDLRGKVVLVNFWATWCPPCRKEMPDLDALYSRFRDQGLVILAISDEDTAKVTAYIAQHPVSYPILLDSDRKVNEEFHIEGIPKSFVYGRDGKMVAQAIDMRTRKQFLEMLGQAGLK